MDPRLTYIFVNYNNSNESILTIDSILKSDFNSSDNIIIVDNNSDEHNILVIEEFLKDKSANIILLKNEHNVGYFGGLNFGIKYVTESKLPFDALIIGNNDLLFPVDFKSKVFEQKALLKKYPVICPNIITLDGEHQNPHVIQEISKFREVIYDISYSNYYFFLMIAMLAKLSHSFTDRKDELQNEVAQEIYQGYGACYILTPLFFKYFNELDNLSFLFYEEFFLSKQLSRAGHKYFYEPSIKLVHRLHSSTSLQPKYKLWKFGREAHLVHRKLNPIFKKK